MRGADARETSPVVEPLSAVARTRLELARGHWSLGEREEALVCLERLASAEPRSPGLADLVGEWSSEVDADGPPDLAGRFSALAQELRPPQPIAPAADSPLVTGTIASLLVEQGHAEQALAVAEGVLRSRPDDPRALAVRERLLGGPVPRIVERLERWLANIERAKRGSAPA